MEENGGRTEFLVVFYDGEREMDIGQVLIKPQLEYKPFQLMLAKKIGISPNQISIYLVDRKQIPKPPFSEDRRRIPVTGKMNFYHVCRLKGCCFLVVLKRSRKWRNRRVRVVNGVECRGILPEKEFPRDPVSMVSKNTVLLRRNHMAPLYDLISPLELDDLNRSLRSLKVERENYPATMAKGNVGSPNSALDPTIAGGCRSNSMPSPVKTIERRDLKAFCGDCWKAEKIQSTTSFHPCVNDTAIPSITTVVTKWSFIQLKPFSSPPTISQYEIPTSALFYSPSQKSGICRPSQVTWPVFSPARMENSTENEAAGRETRRQM